MYAVVCYQNYRKDQDLKVLSIHHDKDVAIKKAYERAVLESGRDNVIDGVEEQYLYLYDAIKEYSLMDSTNVFAVLTLPDVEDWLSASTSSVGNVSIFYLLVDTMLLKLNLNPYVPI